MIIKSSQRGGAGHLAAHLIKSVDDDGIEQQVEISGYRHLAYPGDIHMALQVFEMMSLASAQTKNHLYHISLNPDQDISKAQWSHAWDMYEKEYGLSDYPYIEVTHTKKNRSHQHRIYERVDPETEKALNLSFTKIRNEKVARILEFEFEHELTVGKHNRAVMTRLGKEGREDVATWMREGKAHDVKCPVADKNHDDRQQEQRTKIPINQVKEDLQAIWQRTDNGQTFEAAAAEKGYVLCKGDRRDFVIIDSLGQVHSPRRRLNVKAKELRERWVDLDPNTLPTVNQIRQERNPEQRLKVAADDPKAALQQLREAKAEIEQEIVQLEAMCHQRHQASEDAETDSNEDAIATFDVSAHLIEATHPAALFLEKVAKQSLLTAREGDVADTAKPFAFDQRLLHEQLIHWDKYADQVDRSRPQDSFLDGELQSWGLDHTTLLVLKTTGSKARGERDRRIAIAMRAGEHPEKNPNTASPKASALSVYLGRLGAYLKRKGKGYYRGADRWLAEKLARLGFSRAMTRRVLAEASPELMDQAAGQRLAYIRRIVDQIYQLQEKLREDHKKQQALEARKRSSGRLEGKDVAVANASARRTSANQNVKRQQSLACRYQIKQAFNALNSRDFQGYRGQAIREYRKELARKLSVHGLKMIRDGTGIKTDQDIAIRLYGAGFSRRDIHQAIHKASPIIAGTEVQIKDEYCRERIDTVLNHYKIRQAQQDMWQWRKQKGLHFERRLDKLALATEMSQKKQQDRVKEHEQEPSR